MGEIKEGIKFCPYCGAETTKNSGNEEKEGKSEREKEEKAKAEAKEEKKRKESKKEDEDVPQEIVLESDVQNKMIDFLSLLCKVDADGSGKNFSKGVEIDSTFAYSFLIDSIWFEVPFVEGETAQMGQEGWQIPEEIVREYLEDSIGTEEFDTDHAEISDGNVVLQGVTPTIVYGNDTPQILQVLKISETEIEVLGEVHYTPEMQDAQPYTAAFTVTMTENPESMWGGYTLQSIDEWTAKSSKQIEPVGQKMESGNISCSIQKKSRV